MGSLRTLGIISVCCCTVSLVGCGDDDDGTNKNDTNGCSVVAQTGCLPDQVCEEVVGGNPACFAPVSFQGKVIDALSSAPVVGARVVARDANDAAISTVAITKDDGTYSLTVPAKRDAEGVPIQVSYTLRADAAAYQTFPTAPRVAIPIDVSTAAGSPPVVQSAATDIALIPIPNAAGLGSIAGKVVADLPGGTLVVAGGSTGVADFHGDYVVFNVAAGSAVGVRGYAAGLQLDTTTANVEAGKQTAGVDLHALSVATTTVEGKVEIVNGNGNSITSVVLAVEDTFVENAARGEVPRGLRVGNVSGAFSIPGVPDGRYVVLAAFENDGLVRDPDTSIGGTDILHIEVKGGGVQALADGFKVTGALDVVSPGATEIDPVSGTPKFVWADDSSEDMYEVRVFDALGNKVWEDLAVPSVSGSGDVTVDYAGPALEPGMIYQFRATSMKDTVPISQTEDLKGVFLYQ